MNLKNYTSSVPVINSIAKIEHRLAQAGATHIAKEYDRERPVGMIFQIQINEMPLTFKLPAKADKVYDYMIKQRSRNPKPNQREAIRMQADRTAWKILSDWIDIQVSLVQIQQADVIEVFLPYSFDVRSNQTLFDKVKSGNFKLLNS